MAFFLLNFLADCGEEGYCFTDQLPRGIGLKSYKLSEGMALAGEYPQDPFDARLQLGEDYPGLKQGSFIGNAGRMIIVHKEVSKTIGEFDTGEMNMEVLPFSLLDHKGRVFSRDYVFLNPLTILDCTHHEKSIIQYTKKGKLLKIQKLVLDASRLKAAPDIFRLHEKPNVCLFSEKLVKAIEDGGYINFYFDPADQA